MNNTERAAQDTLEHSDLSWKIHVSNERTGKNNIGMDLNQGYHTCGIATFSADRQATTHQRIYPGQDDANIAFVAIRKGIDRTIYDTQSKVYLELLEDMNKQTHRGPNRAKGLLQVTLANHDLLYLKRPFSKLSYSLRIRMFIGAGVFVIGLATTRYRYQFSS